MLRLENVSFSVDTDGGEKDILRNVSLEFADPFTVITGPNGGGKSTLAKIISGIYKPTSGRIYIDDRDITDMSITDRANAGIGYAFQQPVRFKGITVADLIKIAARYRRYGGVHLSLRGGTVRERLYQPRDKRNSFRRRA